MKPCQFHREADAEFTAALRHYAGISPELGARFYDKVEAAIADARAHPRRFRMIEPPVNLTPFPTPFPTPHHEERTAAAVSQCVSAFRHHRSPDQSVIQVLTEKLTA